MLRNAQADGPTCWLQASRSILFQFAGERVRHRTQAISAVNQIFPGYPILENLDAELEDWKSFIAALHKKSFS
jgi:hypothetical protein